MRQDAEIARLKVQLEISNDKSDHLYKDLVALNREYDEKSRAWAESDD